jgi:hypothetical protein
LVASVNAPGFNFDTTPPLIGTPKIQPATPGPNDIVTVSAIAQDPDSSVKNVSIIYTNDNWNTINKTLVATYDNNTQVAVAQIPAQPSGAHVQYYIIAYDPSGNRGTNNNSGNYFSYNISQPSQPIPWTYIAIALGVIAVLGGILVFALRRN